MSLFLCRSLSYAAEESLLCQPLNPSSPLTTRLPHHTPSIITSDFGHTSSKSNVPIVTTITTPSDSEKAQTALLATPLSVGGIIVLLVAMVMLLVYRQSKTRNRKKASLLLIQHATGQHSSGVEVVAEKDPSAQRSRVLLNTLASLKHRTGEYHTLLQPEKGENRTEITPEPNRAMDVDSGCYASLLESHPIPTSTQPSSQQWETSNLLENGHQSRTESVEGYTNCHFSFFSPAPPNSPTSPTYPTYPTSPTPPASPTYPRLTDSHQRGGSDSASNIEPHNSLFPDWNQPAAVPATPSSTQLVPGSQRPKTMGGAMAGVYSTGHQHHRRISSNCSRVNSNRSSLTSSHGTRASTRTSQSGSQQFGSSLGLGYGSSSTVSHLDSKDTCTVHGAMKINS